jgi:hypothetical protein
LQQPKGLLPVYALTALAVAISKKLTMPSSIFSKIGLKLICMMMDQYLPGIMSVIDSDVSPKDAIA